MTLGQQLLWGGACMGLCLLVQTAFLVWASMALRAAEGLLRRVSLAASLGMMILISLTFILSSHTVQILIWSHVWLSNEVLADWNSAIYFSLVTYTTVGYGDITLGPELRVFGTFAAVAGLLGFGLSSAFLIAVMTRTLHEKLFHDHRS